MSEKKENIVSFEQKEKEMTKFEKIADFIGNIPTKHPTAFALMACIPYMAMCLANPAMADYKSAVGKVIKELVDIASFICSGAGVVVTIMAAYNWLSAIKQQDAERAAANVTNVVIGVVLIFIGPILSAILSAAGLTEFASVANSGGLGK